MGYFDCTVEQEMQNTMLAWGILVTILLLILVVSKLMPNLGIFENSIVMGTFDVALGTYLLTSGVYWYLLYNNSVVVEASA